MAVSDDGRMVENEVEAVNGIRVELLLTLDSKNRTQEEGGGRSAHQEDPDLEYAVDKIVDHGELERNPPNHWTVKVKWFNHAETTWEPLSNVH